ncbi:MAG: nuclear transport factor 2 family protein [Anaerolineales bacterium]|nr:nuclear transport factor 2 family protein [Anaerolineales bacterium]
MTNKEQIIQVIDKAYIQGIHTKQDKALALSGFHPEFRMLVLQENMVEKVSLNEWLARIETIKAENPALWQANTRFTAELVDSSRYAAIAKLQVYKGEVHFSTDYMLLYKFQEGWKIVSKVFDR